MKKGKSTPRQSLPWVLSLLIIASMVCGFVASLQPSRPEVLPSPTPTVIREQPPPTAAPTRLSPTVAPPTVAPPTRQPTPTATLAPEPSPSPAAGQTPTQSAAAGGDLLTFAVCGDNRGGEEIYQQVLKQVQEDGSAFLINTGDLVNKGTEKQFAAFADLMKGFTLPFYPVPGNHDWGEDGLNAYLKYSGAPAAHYSFDQAQAHFSLINTSSGSATQAELEWLAADLQATNQPVKVVVLHHPPFDPGGTTHIMAHGNEAFMRLMRDEGVDLVLSGHIHSYDEAVRDGVRYVITGGAGAALYQTPTRAAYHHYVRVSIRDQEISTEVVRIEK